MTLVAAWVRVTPGGEELVVASDSRLTGGITLDHAPKIFRLERQDAVIAYCGPTLVAYPILLQIKASLDGHEETKSRILDIVHLKSHIEKTIESLRSKVVDLPSKDGTNRAFKFLLAGYSWKTSAFRIWTFRFDLKTGEFNAHSARKSGDFVFMSDSPKNEKLALDTLVRCIQLAPHRSLKRLDWEPLTILMDVIRDTSIEDIGGPPQLVKIYKHANTLPINILWPTKAVSYGIPCQRFEVTHLGRPLLGYERSRYLTLDPESCELVEPWHINARLNLHNSREQAFVLTQLRLRIVRAIAEVRDARASKQVFTRLFKEGASVQAFQRTMERIQNTHFSEWHD
ncbi:hypothetical protein [Polaromonas sp. AER18D-145]|uniref:hypothetical protein n=1 Tax=Polaromonas sp. AER18D-145 TaxID=1977060 RepID=UPI000BBC4BB4|nr:hypothetical protein [Polaromonas sp. AER18D-145]